MQGIQSNATYRLRAILAVSVLLSGCAGPHFDITRQLGISPPKLENKADFHEDAQKRCEWYNPKNTTDPPAWNIGKRFCGLLTIATT